MAGIKIVDLPSLGRDLASTDLFEMSLVGGTGSRKITGQEIMNASKLSVGNTPIVNGAVGQLLFQGAGNVLGESANLFWDNTNVALQLGTTPTSIFTFRPQDTTGTYGNSSSIRGGNGLGRLDFYSTSNITELKDNIIILTSTGGPIFQLGQTDISFNVASSTRLKIAKTTGNVLINTTTDSGYTFDVNGTARVQGNVEIGGASATTVYSTYNSTTRNQNRYTNGSSFEFHEGVNERMRILAGGNVGIGTSSPQGALHIAVATGTPALILSDVGSPNTLPTLQFRRGPLSAYSLQIDFPSNNKARLQIGDAVTGYEITGGNVGLTGGRSIEFGGVTGQIATGIIGSVQTDNNNGQLTFSTRGSGTTAERMRIFNTGNVLINTTTDAGFKFDVNGTARVSGNLTVATGSNFVLAGSSNAFSSPSFALWGGGTGVINVSNGGYGVLSRMNFGANAVTSIPALAINTNELIVRDANNGVATSFGVGVSATINASAKMQIDATDKGFLPPRMTQAQRNAIASPAIGLEIYQTDATEGKYIYKSSGWTYIG